MTAAVRRLTPHPEALAELLRTGQIRRAPSVAPERRGPQPLGTGLAALDHALGGGWTRGQLHEIAAPVSAGGTALLRSALAQATQAGELCALLDPSDTFDVRQPVAPAGTPGVARIDLRRLLWVRPDGVAAALRAAEIALEARFALVAIDLAGTGTPAAKLPKGHVHVVRFEGKKEPRPQALQNAWARLGRRAEKHGGAVIVLTRSPQLGTFSSNTVELERGPSRWHGRPAEPGRQLGGSAAIVAVTRAKRSAPSEPIPFELSLLPE